MTKKEYIRYFNLKIKFNKVVREYLEKFVLKDGEQLDGRVIMHSFVDSKEECDILIHYFLADCMDEEERGKRIIRVPLEKFEAAMGLN